MYMGGSNFATGTAVADLGEITCAAGNGRADPARDASVMCTDAGDFLFRGCGPTANCFGTWSTCAADCQPKVYSISSPLTGDGYQCPYDDSATQPCAAGEDACPVDTNCVGSWSSCTADCSNKVFTIATAQSGQGTQCSAGAGATLMCAAGEDLCPVDTNCVGSWSSCAADCSNKVFTVTTVRSGQGAQCVTSDAATVACRAGEDYCPPDADCVGAWGTCASSCVKTFSVSTGQSGQGAQCTSQDGSVAQDGDPLPCDPGVGLCPLPGTVCSAGSGNRAMYTGGATFDTAITVDPAQQGTIGCGPGYGRADPHRAPSVLCTDSGDFLFLGCEANVNCQGSWSTCVSDCSGKYTSNLPPPVSIP